MKKIYLTVGPSQLYPTVHKYVLNALKEDILSMSHTGERFQKFYREVSRNLRLLLNIPSGHHIFLVSSSTESMERIIANTVYESSMHLITGAFGQKFYKIALDLKKKPIPIEVSDNSSFNFSDLVIPNNIELLCITENDTSTGMRLPLENLDIVKKNNPNLLIAVDIVSSAPYSNLDYSTVDIAFFSGQKGFGLPAGLGILIANDAAIEKAFHLKKRDISVGSNHHSFLNLVEREKKFIMPGTPNVFCIYLFCKVVEDLLSVGLGNIRRGTEIKAKLLYDYFDSHPRYKTVVKDPYRSFTTVVIDVKGESKMLVEKLKQKGLIISAGFRPNEENYIRIANFPAHKIEYIRRLINNLSDIST